MEDYVRVLRLLSYEGPRDKVEKQIERSIHGVKDWESGVKISAVTLDAFPVVMEKADVLKARYYEGYQAGLDAALETPGVLEVNEDGIDLKAFRKP